MSMLDAMAQNAAIVVGRRVGVEAARALVPEEAPKRRRGRPSVLDVLQRQLTARSSLPIDLPPPREDSLVN